MKVGSTEFRFEVGVTEENDKSNPLPVGLVLKVMEHAVNRLLQMDVEQGASLAILEGRTVGVDTRLPALLFYITVADNRVSISSIKPEKVDATLTGTPISLAKLAMSDDPAAIFSGDVKISGDAEVGKALAKVLERIEIDWEEELSRYSGDVLAHQVGNAVRGVRAWVGSVLESAQLNTGEYLTEELQVLPVKYELDSFMSDVDELRADAERLEMRVKRLLSNTVINP